MKGLPKFRAYDKKWDTMYYSHEHDNSPFECRVNLFNGSWEIETCDVEGNDIGAVSVDEKRVFLMRYLGLKDRDGKEYCQGDIVLCGSGTVRVIEYIPACFYGIHKEDWVAINRNNYSNDKIIGDIHRNPELLQNG